MTTIKPRILVRQEGSGGTGLHRLLLTPLPKPFPMVHSLQSSERPVSIVILKLKMKTQRYTILCTARLLSSGLIECRGQVMLAVMLTWTIMLSGSKKCSNLIQIVTFKLLVSQLIIIWFSHQDLFYLYS